MKQISTIFLLVMLSACITPYKDPRPPEVQKAELTTVLRELNGEYTVIDSRNDDRNEYTTLKVIAGDEAMILRLSGKKDNELWIGGSNCIGRSKSEEDQFSMVCNGSSGVNYFYLEKLSSERKVTDGALISRFKPMVVESKNYLLSFWSINRGRPHHYVLKKKGQD